MSEHTGTFVPFTEDDLDAVWGAYKTYLLEILNREYDVEDAIADLQSLIDSDFDPRTTSRKSVSSEPKTHAIPAIAKILNDPNTPIK